MGYASYTVHRRGEEIQAGYAVEDVCNEDGCEAEIDRGLGYLCGKTPGGDEYGCGGYFCGEHLLCGPVDEDPHRCGACYARAETQRCEEFCDALATAVQLMDGVASAGAVDGKPEVFVDFTNGWQVVLGVG